MYARALSSALAVAFLTLAAASSSGRAASSGAFAQAGTFRPVTDDLLQNPPASDWLHWRRTYDGSGYSPLDQINRQNVGQLRLAWSWAMQGGNQQTTPLVHDGVMYLANPGSTVQALNAATGELLWEYRREFPAETRQQARDPRAARPEYLRGSDFREHRRCPHRRARRQERRGRLGCRGDRSQAAVLVFGAGRWSYAGKIISGLQSCEYFYEQKCAITAHDARTGKELWRTSTIAHPGQPGGDTWGDVPLMFRAGADMWITGSYDPSLNLVFWSTAQAKPWSRAARGTDGDALYSNTVLALDPETGKIVWHNQLLPGETHDMDEVFENILVDDGPRKSLFKMGKLGILWQLDRQTGKFVNARDLGYQNLVDVDRTTGKVTYRPGMVPKLGEVIDFCPSTCRLQELARDGLSPRDARLLRAAAADVPEGQLHRREEGRGRRRPRTGASRQLLPPGEQRQPRRIGRD